MVVLNFLQISGETEMLAGRQPNSTSKQQDIMESFF